MEITDLADGLTRALGAFEPGAYSAADCARLAEKLSATGKACAAGSVLAASRAVALGAHKELGYSDPASWVAHQAGTTTRQAKDALSTARHLDALPETKQALLKGEISLPEAHEIARAGAGSPAEEGELLSAARRGNLTTLRDEVRDRRLGATPPDELHRAQLDARRFRSWRDGLGMVRLEGALPPETGIPLVTRVERRAKGLVRARRRPGDPEPFERLAADALVELCSGTGEGPPRRGRAELVIVCDLSAWRRGHAHEGEPCHLVGGGPLPVEVAQELSEDAFIKAVLHDGQRIQVVSHPGRRYTAPLRTALDLGPVPAFSGRECTDCGRRYGLENDHVDPVAHTGPTSYANVRPRCYPCHAAKTERDRKAGLLGRAARARAPGSPWKAKRPSRSPVKGKAPRDGPSP